MKNNLRNEYICNYPFTYTEIADDTQWLCCPSWLPENIKESDNYKDNWYSEKSNKIRSSILDGSYKYCDSKKCPYLSALDNGITNNSVFTPKAKFEESELSDPKARVINMGFDLSCNLQCPSCRLNFINLKDKDRDRVNFIMNNIETQLGDDIETMILCGGAEPFFSKTFLTFMKEFDKNKWPSLKHIHLHTNANLWTESNWNRVSKIHKYVKSCEISIDAATKETYETKVRLRGDWDKLITNLKFIVNIPTIKRMRFSFVVQEKNYKEMYLFYELIQSLTKGKGKKIEILFNGISDWGAYPTKDEFLKEEIHNPLHPSYNDFVHELAKIKNLNVHHTFHHIIKKDTQLI
jgi:organic radical activating enzyme